jgi:HK97 family phage portal protein
VALFSRRWILGLFGKAALSSVTENRSGWWRLFESFPGAWQQNVTVDRNLVLSYHAVYACMTLIASDIAKLPLRLVMRDGDGIWTETDSASFSPVLRKPNALQTRIQFWEYYFLSKLMRGNVYVLKGRDDRRIVNRLWVLDPQRVVPMVADDGSLFYQLSTDNIAGLTEEIMVPAREIIHDRMNCLFHPLVGTSPIFAAGVAATQGLRIQNNSAWFFGNKSQPGGILTAPGAIAKDTAERLKALFEANFTGENAGRIAVLGDNLKYEPLGVNARDSQLIDQLKWTADVVCSVFHVPPYKIGLGEMPTYNNVQALNVEYYSQALQSLIEAAELCLDEGLGLAAPTNGKTLGTEFDIDGLLRMDTVTQVTSLKEEVSAGIRSPNEARALRGMKPVIGGESPYLQQQNYSLAALSKRDAQENPFGGSSDPGVQEFDVLRARFDAYGVGVRAGALTPQADDERAFREEASYPSPSSDVEDAWKLEPIRRPITLKSVLDDPALAEPAPELDPEPEDPPPAEDGDDDGDIEREVARALAVVWKGLAHAPV